MFQVPWQTPESQLKFSADRPPYPRVPSKVGWPHQFQDRGRKNLPPINADLGNPSTPTVPAMQVLRISTKGPLSNYLLVYMHAYLYYQNFIIITAQVKISTANPATPSPTRCIPMNRVSFQKQTDCPQFFPNIQPSFPVCACVHPPLPSSPCPTPRVNCALPQPPTHAHIHIQIHTHCWGFSDLFL